MQKYLYTDLYNLEETHWWHKAKRELVSYFIRHNLSRKNSTILDVGCGTGKNLATFSEYGKVWGIDSANEAITFCKKRGFNNVTIGNVEKMPYKKNSFDLITALDVLEHVDETKALKEINRVLGKDGILIITVPAFQWLWSRWDEVLHHKRRYTEKTLQKVLKNNKFEIVKISYIYSFLLLPILIIRTLKKLFYKDYYPSDFQLSNKITNYFLTIIANIERVFIRNHKIPFGTSLIVVAKRTNK